MKSTRGKIADTPAQTRRAGTLGQEKAALVSNSVELTRVKLQRLPDAFSSSVWSTDGITNGSRLYQRSSSTPPTHDAAVHHTSKGFLVPREDAQSGMQLAYHLADASASRPETQDNQTEACETATPASIGVDIQRSWSAPPIADQTRALEGNQREVQNLSPLTLDKLKTKGFLPNLLGKPHNDNDSAALWSTVSERKSYSLVCESPDRSDTHVVSDVSYDSTPGFSNQDSNASSSVCSESSSRDGSPLSRHAPPGLPQIDSIHDGFARSQVHDYGCIAPSSGNAMFLADEIEGIAQLRIDNQPRYHQDAIMPAAFGYAFNDMHQSRQIGPEYPGSGGGGFQQSRAPSRSGNQPTFAHALFSSPSPYAVHPYSSSLGFRSRPHTGELLKQPWAQSEDPYYRGGASNLSYPSRRAGPEYQFKPFDIYGAMKPSEPLVRDHRSYTPARAPHGFAVRESFHPSVARPSAQYRSKPNDSRRSEHAFLHPVVHSYSSSSLLEEFASASKADKWELSTIKGHLLIFARDQSGSRFIQQRLEKADDQAKAAAFEEIFPNALVLMTDVFGNYVIQKFFEHGSLTQQQRLIGLMRTNMVSLALQVYGCRVIQRALEVTQVDEQLTVMKELHGHVQKCIEDQNGNHVLQKCIEAASWRRSVASGVNFGAQRRLTGEDVQFIIDAVIGRVAGYSGHSYGCRVIQRILEHCSPTQIRPIVSEIVAKCRELMKDQFGNYVVQHVIGHGEPDQRRVVMDAVLPDIARWSQHKFASNVVEACLERATKAEISRTVDFILQCDETGSSCPLLPMMKHMYGNYVVQKLLDKADAGDRERIVCIIRHNADYLRRFTFGKHVLSRLERDGSGNNY